MLGHPFVLVTVWTMFVCGIHHLITQAGWSGVECLCLHVILSLFLSLSIYSSGMAAA